MKSKSAKVYLKSFLSKYSDNRSSDVRPDKDLIQLSKKSDVSGALAALKAGAKVNAVDAGSGRTALHFAVEKNCLPLVGILRGWSPLMYAAREGYLSMVELLLTYGADPGYRSPHLGITAADLAIGIRRKGPRELSVEKQIEFDEVISLLSKAISSSSTSF